MNLVTALIIVNFVAVILILTLTSKHETPSYIKPGDKAPRRIFGIFSTRDIVATSIVGILIAYMSNTNIFLAIGLEFIIGSLIHLAFGVKTMPLYKLGLSKIPDGTGILANPVAAPKLPSK
jgi:hypothetical protein